MEVIQLFLGYLRGSKGPLLFRKHKKEWSILMQHTDHLGIEIEFCQTLSEKDVEEKFYSYNAERKAEFKVLWTHSKEIQVLFPVNCPKQFAKDLRDFHNTFCESGLQFGGSVHCNRDVKRRKDVSEYEEYHLYCETSEGVNPPTWLKDIGIAYSNTLVAYKRGEMKLGPPIGKDLEPWAVCLLMAASIPTIFWNFENPEKGCKIILDNIPKYNNTCRRGGIADPFRYYVLLKEYYSNF